MSISAVEYLRHIRDEARFLSSAVAGVGISRFMGDEVLKRACVRALEVMGEAAKKVPEDLRSRHPDLDWKRMAAMRDRLIHGYFGVDYTIVYEVALERAPTIARRLDEVIAAESSAGSQ